MPLELTAVLNSEDKLVRLSVSTQVWKNIKVKGEINLNRKNKKKKNTKAVLTVLLIWEKSNRHKQAKKRDFIWIISCITKRFERNDLNQTIISFSYSEMV